MKNTEPLQRPPNGKQRYFFKETFVSILLFKNSNIMSFLDTGSFSHGYIDAYY